jgi:hypothetical protein
VYLQNFSQTTPFLIRQHCKFTILENLILVRLLSLNGQSTLDFCVSLIAGPLLGRPYGNKAPYLKKQLNFNVKWLTERRMYGSTNLGAPEGDSNTWNRGRYPVKAKTAARFVKEIARPVRDELD